MFEPLSRQSQVKLGLLIHVAVVIELLLILYAWALLLQVSSIGRHVQKGESGETIEI